MKTGLALAYSLVERATWAVRPIAGELLAAADASGPIRCTPGLALHVLRLETAEPVASLSGVGEAFQARLRELGARLEPQEARLLPGGMHPFMDPASETRLTPGDPAGGQAVLERIFGLRRHGWVNAQAAELALPFVDEDEFARLHTALRVVLPILPALGASSPWADGMATGFMDSRLEHERQRAARAPAVAGLLVPELVFSRAEYEREILAPIAHELRALDPTGALRPAALNARLASADFERKLIRVRALDVQECPAADVALAALLLALLQALVEERDGFASYARQKELETGALAKLLRDTIRDAERAVVREPKILRALGVPAAEARSPMSAGELWRRLVPTCLPDAPENLAALARLDVILREGPLARRLTTLAAAATPPLAPAQIAALLAEHLERGRLVRAGHEAPAAAPS